MATLLGLALSGGGWALPQFASRFIHMTFQPIDASAQLMRDINGNLIDVSHEQFRKYKGTISCDDQESPGFAEVTTDLEGVWPGSIFTLTCITQLGSAEQMTLMVRMTQYSVNRDEMDAATSWSMDWEQV